MALVVLSSLAATRGRAAAACPSTCTLQLAECKRTCAGSGLGRRECRAACAERSTCTAPGARIRTLAYVVTECSTDPQGLTSGKQKLLIRRRNCDPVTVMEGAVTPIPDPTRECAAWGEGRFGDLSGGAFQRMAVLPDGSGVVFEVTKQFSPIPPAAFKPGSREGLFFVRLDGSGLRWLGPPSRFPPIFGGFILTGPVFSVTPDGRRIALIDLGPDMAGHEAPQIFLLDLQSGRRTQLTHQSQVASTTEQPIRFAGFLDGRTIGFLSGVPELNTPIKSYRIKTHGDGVPEEIPPPALVPGARLVAQFAVTGGRPQVFPLNFPDRQAVNPAREDPALGSQVFEMFLSDGKDLLQLTNFGRNDTGFGRSFVARGRVFFMASANPFGENPAEICQVFSISTRGGDLRQVTHLPSDGRPYSGCAFFAGGTCTINYFSLVPDREIGTVLFQSSCDPVGGNPFGSQIFSMRSDGSGLRQLTTTRGMTIDPDGTVRVEMPGPMAYSTFLQF